MPTATSTSRPWSRLFSKKAAPSKEEKESAQEIAEQDDAQVIDGDTANANATIIDNENAAQAKELKKKEKGKEVESGAGEVVTGVKENELEPARQSGDSDDEKEDEELYSGRILFFNK